MPSKIEILYNLAEQHGFHPLRINNERGQELFTKDGKYYRESAIANGSEPEFINVPIRVHNPPINT